MGRLNLTHACYQAVGKDTFNPIAGRPVTINAQNGRGRVVLRSRLGARPLNRAEPRALYVHSRTGDRYIVRDQPVEHLQSHAGETGGASLWLARLRHWLFAGE